MADTNWSAAATNGVIPAIARDLLREKLRCQAGVLGRVRKLDSALPFAA